MLASARALLAGPLTKRLPCSGYTVYRGITARVPTEEDDIHDDFKPKFKAEAEPRSAPSAVDQIKQDISSHDVFLYMKGVPEAPQCGFSNMACRILDAYGVEFGSRNVLADPAIREAIKEYSQWPTIPQVYIKGEFVGGSDILMGMHQSGELTEALEAIKKS
ncbi:Monothiol glutaredoxin-S15, mitochondrial [Coccomyxa sp. Obi]|nr:Monothiol glutaredoxin-S15, mitochondrial [Coccomyxa sp. Obi]